MVDVYANKIFSTTLTEEEITAAAAKIAPLFGQSERGCTREAPAANPNDMSRDTLPRVRVGLWYRGDPLA